MPYDHILIMGFGGPEELKEVRPFLRQVANGRDIPEARLKLVEHHYELVGGKSPYNENVFSFQVKFQSKLQENGFDLPVYVGMRNWHPFLEKTLSIIREAGHQKGLAIPFAPHRSIHSCYRYKQELTKVKPEELGYDFHSGFSENETFLQTHAAVLNNFLEEKRLFKEIPVLFSAHSIPEESLGKCNQCHYQNEVETSAYRIAERARLKKWEVVYQSRSGNPRQPWLGPDINDMVKILAEQGEKKIVVCPIGFFCENVEILYDIDLEAKELAEKQDITLYRSPIIPTDSLVEFFSQALTFPVLRTK